jgi:hypothetical protein
MMRTTGLLPALALCWLGLVGPAVAQHAPQPAQQGQTAGPISVPAGGGWVRAGLAVRKGGQVQLIVVRDGRRAVQVPGVTAQRATAPTPTVNGIPDTRGPLLQTANAGAVIARIGDGAPFVVGRGYSGQVQADGDLWLALNDSASQPTAAGAVLILARATPPPAAEPREPPQTTATPPTTSPPQRQPPATTTPPPTAQPVPPTRTPPTAPPTRAPPETKPPAATLPPVEETPPPIETPPVEDAGPPLVEPTPQPAPPAAFPPPAEPAPAPIIPAQWLPFIIGGALLAGLLLLLSLFRPSRAAREAHEAAAGSVIGTRVARNGVEGQTLVIKERRR